MIDTLRQELLRRTKATRQPHVLGVEGIAVLLAHRWNLDPIPALTAALLHDLAKPYGRDEQREMMERCRLYPPTAEDLEHPSIWHGFISAQEGHDHFGIQDRSLLDAVAYHPTGQAGMDDLALNLFVADFIEPSRSFPGVVEIRRDVLAESTPRGAARIVAKKKLSDLHEKGRSVHPRTRDLLSWLENPA